jgi:hypothetical protein
MGFSSVEQQMGCSSLEQQMGFSSVEKTDGFLLCGTTDGFLPCGTTDVLFSVEQQMGFSSVEQQMGFSSVENRCHSRVTYVLFSEEQQMSSPLWSNRCSLFFGKTDVLSSELVKCHRMSSIRSPSYNRRPDKIPTRDQICSPLKGCIFSLLLSKSSRRLLFLCPKLVGPLSVLLQRCQIISHWWSEVSLQRYSFLLGIHSHFPSSYTNKNRRTFSCATTADVTSCNQPSRNTNLRMAIRMVRVYI